MLSNRLRGLQGADWYEKLENQRGDLARQIGELEIPGCARRMIDLPRLERALGRWPAGAWHSDEVFQEYNLALTRGWRAGDSCAGLKQAN